MVRAVRKRSQWKRVTALLLLLGLIATIAITVRDTLADPLVRRVEVAVPGLPADSAPLTVMLLADTHVAEPVMPPDRLLRLVSQLNVYQPDIIVAAGDFVSDSRLVTEHFPAEAAIAPLGALEARLGKVAVPGNHDHWRDIGAVTDALAANGFTVLRNEAVRIGPLAIGGLDDAFTGHADIAATIAELARLGGAPIVVSHSPDPFPDLPDDIVLTLAGHTHCGQVRWPWGGSPATMSDYGDRYACGLVEEDGRTIVTTAGMGVSVVPIRFLAKPDVWLIDLVPQGD